MSEFNFQKYALMCMRLAAECRGLAADVSEPDLRAHYPPYGQHVDGASGSTPYPALEDEATATTATTTAQ
jgi:hypothetical protein